MKTTKLSSLAKFMSPLSFSWRSHAERVLKIAFVKTFVKSAQIVAPIILFGILFGFHSQNLSAQTSASVGSNVSILAPISVSSSGELEFGYVQSGDVGGSVTVTTGNVRSVTGGVTAYSSDYHRADFLVVGIAGLSYTITASAELEFHESSSSSSSSGPLAGLRIVNLTVLSVTKGVEGLIGKVGPDGTDIVYVGGTLEVPANVPRGEFEGEVTLTVHY